MDQIFRMLRGQGPASTPHFAHFSLKARPGQHLPLSRTPNSSASVCKLHLQPPHTIKPKSVSPHPHLPSFPLPSLHIGATALPRQVAGSGDQPTLLLPSQQRGRLRHDKASQSEEPGSVPFPSWLPAAASPRSSAGQAGAAVGRAGCQPRARGKRGEAERQTAAATGHRARADCKSHWCEIPPHCSIYLQALLQEGHFFPHIFLEVTTAGGMHRAQTDPRNPCCCSFPSQAVPKP